MPQISPMSEFTVVRLPGGSKLSLCQWGPAGGAPVILCHGAPGSRRFRHPNGEYERLGLRVVVYDRPGYGASTSRSSRRTVESAAHVAAVADHLGYERFAVVGLSGGAGHALAAASQLGDRVTRCVLIVPMGPFDAPGLDHSSG